MEEFKLLTEENEQMQNNQENLEAASDEVQVDNGAGVVEEEISKLKKSADVFGVTERELEDEFLDYKIDKLLKQIDYFITEPINDLLLKDKILSAQRIGFGSITVLPDRIAQVTRFLGGKKFEVNTILSYPFGAELAKVKIYALKQLVKLPISSISLPICPLMLSFNNLRQTYALVKKLKKIAKKKQLKILADINSFGQTGLANLVKLLNENKIDRISVMVNDGVISNLNTLMTLAKGKISVEVCGGISLKLGASMLNLGVQRLSASNAEELSTELIEKLKK